MVSIKDVGPRVRQTLEEGRRTYRPKRCRNNKKDEDNSPKNLKDKKKNLQILLMLFLLSLSIFFHSSPSLFLILIFLYDKNPSIYMYTYIYIYIYIYEDKIKSSYDDVISAVDDLFYQREPNTATPIEDHSFDR